MVLPLNEALHVAVASHYTAGRGPLGRVTHSGVRGVGENGAGGTARFVGVCHVIVPAVPTDLVGDLEIFEGVLDLPLSQSVDVHLGVWVGVWVRGQAGAVRR